ncbi:hypothetical protein SAMN05216525_114158 [Bradyrhizobium sp. Gha]|nr:hypothetical protein SAMN05216525_114158 [Bradyrhizobium sp. Gha]
MPFSLILRRPRSGRLEGRGVRAARLLRQSLANALFAVTHRLVMTVLMLSVVGRAWARGRFAVSASYLFFHPPRRPGAPPVDFGAGPNSGPDCRESVGWMIRLVLPNGFDGSDWFSR